MRFLSGVPMLKNAVLFAAVACLFAVFGPSLVSRLAPAPSPSTPARTLAVAAPPAAASGPPAQPESSNFREIVIPADRRGQYSATVMLNGVDTFMLVDTGATIVTISAATARRIGATPSSDFKWRMQTANGVSTASPTLIHTLAFGGIFMTDVDAVILPPQAGDVNLLGASFLKRLVGVEQRSGMLVLHQ
jgi:aspartyl protease family protein